MYRHGQKCHLCIWNAFFFWSYNEIAEPTHKEGRDGPINGQTRLSINIPGRNWTQQRRSGLRTELGRRQTDELIIPPLNYLYCAWGNIILFSQFCCPSLSAPHLNYGWTKNNFPSSSHIPWLLPLCRGGMRLSGDIHQPTGASIAFRDEQSTDGNETLTLTVSV